MPLKFDPVEEAKRNWARRGITQPVPGMTSIMRASQITLLEVNGVLRPFGLNYARYEALMLLTFSRHGSLPLGKIGERLQVHPTSVTNTIDRLEADGLVRRVSHPQDRRAVLAELTESGRERAESATEALRVAPLSIRSLGEAEVEQLTALIRKIRLTAGDFTGDAADEPSPDGSRSRPRKTSQPRQTDV
jgi:DNA-binding MarR family transcriptional regulator